MNTEYIDSLDEAAYISRLEQQNQYLEMKNDDMRNTLCRILIWWQRNDKNYADSIFANEIREAIK
jgi:hypothetical protein